MNSTVIGLLFVVLILVVALVVFLLTRKETPEPKGFSFQIDNLGMSIEKTKPVESYTIRGYETYELRNLDDIEKPADDNDNETIKRDYLNKFIDFQIAWTNPSTDMLSESVAYLKLKRTLPSGSVYNYYIVNQDILDVDDVIPEAETGEKNIVYKPTSVDGVQAVGASDTAASAGNDNFFSPGAEVKLMLYGFDLNAGEDLVGEHKFELIYLVDGEVERLATIKGDSEDAVNDVKLTTQLTREQAYSFDFSGSTQQSVIKYNIITDTFGISFVSESMYKKAGTIFRMCFKCLGKGFNSYKWLIKDGDNNIKVQNTSFRYEHDKDSSLVTSGSNVLPNFNDPNICRFKVILTDGTGGVKLGIGDGFLKYNKNPSGSESVLTVVQGEENGTTFYIEEISSVNTTEGAGTYFLVYRGDGSSGAVYFAYDSDNNKLTTIIQSEMNISAKIKISDYAGFQYMEELKDLDTMEGTPLVTTRSISGFAKFLDNGTPERDDNQVLITNYIITYPGTIDLSRVNKSGFTDGVKRLSHTSGFTDRLTNVETFIYPGGLSSISNKYKFIFEKVENDIYDNIYYIKTAENVTQQFRSGNDRRSQTTTTTGMYLRDSIIDGNFELITDTGDHEHQNITDNYDSKRLKVQIFNAPKLDAKGFISINSTASIDDYESMGEILILKYDSNDELVEHTNTGTGSLSFGGMRTKTYLGGNDSFVIFE